MLPLLWSMFPGHPYLIPAFYDNPVEVLGEEKFKALKVKNWIARPLYSNSDKRQFESENFNTF